MANRTMLWLGHKKLWLNLDHITFAQQMPDLGMRVVVIGQVEAITLDPSDGELLDAHLIRRGVFAPSSADES